MFSWLGEDEQILRLGRADRPLTAILASGILPVMQRDILRYVATAVLLFTFLIVSGAPVVAVAFGQGEAVDSCCYPSDNHDEPSQSCDMSPGCSCLFCLHFDLRQTAWFFNRPLSLGVSDFPVQSSVLSDFPQTIEYPPESS
ncbi:MAG: hypothetical protein KKD73_05195 [Proteobacteria bacterium]|nr:hypothetical protein [Pseudomonadota bacterium]MBU1641615.1 hypothetical protein [Pseudomonadota bacterium]